MKQEMVKMVKVEKFWVLIINHEDGTVNDYRFKTQKAAKAYAARLGMEI